MKIPTVAALGLLLAASVQVSQAISIDLTTAGSSGTANGGFFQQIPDQSTGTGVIEPFVRLQNRPTEEGYNTGTGDPMPHVKEGLWTHELLVSEVPTVTLGLIEYYQFLLDINEQGSTSGSLITLYELEIWTKTGTLASANEYADLANGGATKVWDLDSGPDGDSKIELNYLLNSGSGSGDMFAYIPVPSVGTDGSKNLYLYSAFGTPQASDAGFEEWAVLEAGTPNRVPDGGTTLVSLGVALLGLGAMRKHLARKA